MRGVNKVILIGHLGQDPDVKFMPSGTAVANLSLATDESYKDKNTGNKVEKTEWHRLAMFGKLAEIAGEYLKKGAPVYIEGSLRTRKYQAKDGSDRYSTEIVVAELRMLGGKPGEQASARQSPSSSRPAGKPKREPGRDDEPLDDDIPF